MLEDAFVFPPDRTSAMMMYAISSMPSRMLSIFENEQ